METGYKVEITIISCTTLEYADANGKQDPYALFNYNDNTYQTRYIAGAGLTAKWNERFPLTNVQEDSMIVIELWDKDWVSSDFIGQTEAIIFEDFDKAVTLKELELKDGKNKKTGTIKVRITKEIRQKKEPKVITNSLEIPGMSELELETQAATTNMEKLKIK